MIYKTQSYMPQLIESIRTLVRYNTVQQPAQGDAPFGKPLQEALDYVLQIAASWGWRTSNLDNKCGWAEVGEGPLFGVLGHVDVVPLGDGWHHDPLGGEIVDGKLYGRGAQDDKGPLMAAMYALKALLDEGHRPKMRVRFIVGCNEETDWECMDRYLATEEIPAMALSPDGDFPVINCEKALGHYEISFAAPASLRRLDSGDRVNMVPDLATCEIAALSQNAREMAQKMGVTHTQKQDSTQLVAYGKSAHGSTPWLGDNALIKLFAVLANDVPLFATLYHLLDDSCGAHCGLGYEDAASGKTSMNLGYAHLVDGQIKIGLDIRYPLAATQDDIVAALRTAFAFGAVQQVHTHPSLYVPSDHPLVVGLLDAYQDVMGDRPAPLCIGGATYARALPNAVAFGPVFPGDPEMCHQVDEYIRLDRLQQMTEIYRAAFLRLCC